MECSVLLYVCASISHKTADNLKIHSVSTTHSQVLFHFSRGLTCHLFLDSEMFVISHFCPDDDWSIQSKRRQVIFRAMLVTDKVLFNISVQYHHYYVCECKVVHRDKKS